MTNIPCMHGDCLYYYTEAFDLYDFGNDHPFTPLRQQVTHSLIKECGLLPFGHVSDIEPIDDALLELVHTSDYIQVVRIASDNADGRFPCQAGIGPGDTPPFFGMHEAATIRTAATVAAVESVVEGDAVHAVNLGGGFHHAFPGRASGFCVYNDIAVAIEYIRRKHDLRVAYVDLDAHHGDGVQWFFYDRPDVLTISLHETGRTLFPGTGAVEELGKEAGLGTSVNMPFEPETGDRSWLACFAMIVPEVLTHFAPDVIISQHGVDAHRLDPLTHMNLSCAAFNEAARTLHALAHELCGGRWIALGGGGYEPWRVVPRAWAALWAVASHQPLPRTIPPGWHERWQQKSPVPMPSTMDDPAGLEEEPEIYEKNIKTAAHLLRLWREVR